MPTEPTYTVDAEGILTVKDEHSTISLNLWEVFREITDEEKTSVAEALTWGPVMDEAIQRLLGHSNSWGSSDRRLTLRLLRQMEQHVLSGYPWSVLDEVSKVAKQLVSNESTYFRIFHSERIRQMTGLRGSQILEAAGATGPHVTEHPAFDAFKETVETTLKEASKLIRVPEEEPCSP